ncbi:MAG: RNA 2',3'-cyclic phosphodiesterase [Bdellovibrionota bacterium]
MRYQRLFIGVLPQPEIVKDLAAIQQVFSSKIGKAGLKVRLTKPENLHLTLHFIGPAEEKAVDTLLARVSELAERHRSFSQVLDVPVAFPSKARCRVAGLGANAPGTALLKLWQDLGAALHGSSLPLENRTYVPHVSLLRCPQPMRFPDFLVEPYALRIDSYALIESRLGGGGSKYEILKSFRLL